MNPQPQHRPPEGDGSRGGVGKGLLDQLIFLPDLLACPAMSSFPALGDTQLGLALRPQVRSQLVLSDNVPSLMRPKPFLQPENPTYFL